MKVARVVAAAGLGAVALLNGGWFGASLMFVALFLLGLLAIEQ